MKPAFLCSARERLELNPMAPTKLSRDAYDRLVEEHKQLTTEGRI